MPSPTRLDNRVGQRQSISRGTGADMVSLAAGTLFSGNLAFTTLDQGYLYLVTDAATFPPGWYEWSGAAWIASAPGGGSFNPATGVFQINDTANVPVVNATLGPGTVEPVASRDWQFVDQNNKVVLDVNCLASARSVNVQDAAGIQMLLVDAATATRKIIGKDPTGASVWQVDCLAAGSGGGNGKMSFKSTTTTAMAGAAIANTPLAIITPSASASITVTCNVVKTTDAAFVSKMSDPTTMSAAQAMGVISIMNNTSYVVKGDVAFIAADIFSVLLLGTL